MLFVLFVFYMLFVLCALLVRPFVPFSHVFSGCGGSLSLGLEGFSFNPSFFRI